MIGDKKHPRPNPSLTPLVTRPPSHSFSTFTRGRRPGPLLTVASRVTNGVRDKGSAGRSGPLPRDPCTGTVGLLLTTRSPLPSLPSSGLRPPRSGKMTGDGRAETRLVRDERKRAASDVGTRLTARYLAPRFPLCSNRYQPSPLLPWSGLPSVAPPSRPSLVTPRRGRASPDERNRTGSCSARSARSRLRRVCGECREGTERNS